MILFRPFRRSWIAVALAGTLVGVPSLVAQARGGKAAARPAPRAQQPRPQQAPRPNARQPDNHRGEQLFDRLMRMTPGDREKALSQLPPKRRQQLEQRMRNFQDLPPAVQTRRLDRLERLNSLPPQRQNEVRQSMKDLQDLPDGRKKTINQEMNRMSRMTDDERAARMNSDDFRNRYSPDEQRMMGNLAEILPPKE
jgi:phage-related protein